MNGRYFVTTTLTSGERYRVCRLTGKTRIRETANMFGAGTLAENEVETFEMLHPDDIANEHAPSPYGKDEQPVGIGRALGLDWIKS